MFKPDIHRLLKLFILAILIWSMLFLVAGPLLPRLIDINSYRERIVSIIEENLKRKISIGTISFDWKFGPEFIVSDLNVMEKASDETFLSARTVSFRLRLIPLIKNRIQFGYIVVDGLKARISRNKDGILNIADMIDARKGETELILRKMRLKNSEIYWTDNALGTAPLEISFSEIQFYIDQLKKGKKSKLALYAKIKTPGKTGSIKTHGTVLIPASPSNSLKAVDFDGLMELKDIEYGMIWRYLGKHIPFENPGGLLDVDTTVKGRLNELKANGVIKIHNPRLIWKNVFNYPVAPSLISVNFDLKRTPSSIELPSINLALDGFSIRGTARLNGLDTKDPFLFAKATTEHFEYKNIKTYIPFGIIEKDASEFIENKIKSGIFRLENGSIEGHFSKLAKFTEGDNANALYISGTAENAVIRYGEKAPLFNNIKGELELKGKNFNLHRMSGYFGSSPFTMDGSITDYSTSGVPSEYPFLMQITPRPPEVAWVAAIAGLEKISFTGDSTLRLLGEGPVREFRLSGDWQLQKALYEYPDVIKKPSGMQNSLKFSSILTKDESRLTWMSYILPPLQVTATARLRHSDTPTYFAFDLKTNQFNFRPRMPILQIIQQYKPHGIMQANLKGSGDPRQFRAMNFAGDVRFSGFSARLHDRLSEATGIDGLITFKGNSVQSSDIKALIGKTPVSLRGRIAALKNPEVEFFLTSPRLLTTDFGLEPPSAPQIKNFSASLAYKNGLVTVRNVDGKMEKSVFSAAGTIRPGKEPDLNFRVAATYLDMQEFLNLIPTSGSDTSTNGAVSDSSRAGQIHPFRLKSFISAEKGNYRDLKFTKMSALIDNEGGLVQMRQLNAGLFGGKVKAKGKLQRRYKKPNLWNLSLELEKIKSDELMGALGINREIHGLLSANGTFRAEGDTLDSLKRTTSGNMALRIDKGVLRRFNSLSKVLSLLNLSQLLTFKLPDMSREGMPFNRITATASIKDGIITGQDFFIDSNAMHISMIGDIDIYKETLTLLIGVQPLQTVDKVVSRIPVVGWILTGGDGSFVTTYFEAKGSWSDPLVKAVPVQSLATGTFEIFRRVFELPVRLFTDTGEVILGNQKERPKAKEEK